MAEWATDLHDGELYLPSDIFPDDSVVHPSSGNNLGSSRTSTLRPQELDLARKLAALRLLDPSHPIRSRPTAYMSSKLVGFRPEAPHNAVVRGAECSFGYGRNGVPVGNDSRSVFWGGGAAGGGGHGSWLRSSMVAPDQVGRYEKARFIQRQPNQMHDRFYPLRTNGPPFRETSGTGVFIPCIKNNGSTKNRGMKSRGEQQRPQQHMKVAAALGGKKGMAFHLPNDMGLPQDWTYSP